MWLVAVLALVTLVLGVVLGVTMFRGEGDDDFATASEADRTPLFTTPTPSATQQADASQAGGSTADADGVPVLEVGSIDRTETVWRSTEGGAQPPAPTVAGATRHQQTASLVGDLDNDGDMDMVVATRTAPGPSVVWYEQTDTGWELRNIDSEVLPIEAGGALADIDGDGDLDVSFGGDAKSDQMWWWENPGTLAATAWNRRLIKDGGGVQHHDQAFGDVDGDGFLELVYWNQQPRPGGDRLFVADIPEDPTDGTPWPATEIFANNTKSEGIDIFDIDGDGLVDIVAAGRWFKRTNDGQYTPETIDAGRSFSRIVAGQLIPGGRAEVVIDSGDEVGSLTWYSYKDGLWEPTVLNDVSEYGHSLRVADIDIDGNLDIFSAEMLSPRSPEDPENADASMQIFYGDGNGGFTASVIVTGIDNHESRLADLDGDGDLDILSKPFNGGDGPGISVWYQAPGVPGQASSNGVETVPVIAADLDVWNRQVIDANQNWKSLFVLPADIDGDGDSDIVAGGWWYANPATPGVSWQRTRIGAPLNNVGAVYDFDSDGDLDVLGTAWKDGGANRRVSLGVNDGFGVFRVVQLLQVSDGDFLQGIDVGRLAPGGPVEVVLSWHEAGVGTVALTVPSDPLTDRWNERRLSSVSLLEQIAITDVDLDGDEDIMMGTSWLRQDGGEFSPVVLHQTDMAPDRVVMADIDGDGDEDVVIGYEESEGTTLAWYERGDDPSQPWEEHPVAELFMPLSVDVGDIDGDGDLDIVAGEHNLANPQDAGLFVFENLGGEWESHLVYRGDEHHDGAQLADFDRDGALDIVSTGFEQNEIIVYYNG